MGVTYRIGQFRRILNAKPLPATIEEEIAGILSSGELSLFRRCAAHDQWHGYRVMETLRSAGHTDSDLLIAALLHDVGKIRYRLSIWERSLIVLAQVLFPGRAAVWGKGPARGWKTPFVVKAQHPAWGAEMALEAGSTVIVASLIRRHQDVLPSVLNGEEELLLSRLQWADNQN